MKFIYSSFVCKNSKILYCLNTIYSLLELVQTYLIKNNYFIFNGIFLVTERLLTGFRS